MCVPSANFDKIIKIPSYDKFVSFLLYCKTNSFSKQNQVRFNKTKVNTLKPLNLTPNTSSFEVRKQTISFEST